MEYFYISQDKRYRNSPEIYHFYDKYYPNLFTPEGFHQIPDKNIIYCENKKTMDMIDIISGPVIFISEAVKKVFYAYDDTICFKLFFLLNINTDQADLYYTSILPKIDCLKRNKIDDKLYLNDREIAGQYIFKASGEPFKNGIIVNMEVAESLLRRNLKGFNYQRLEVQSCQNIL